jgi:transcriptional regulator of heat shock response
MSSEDRRNNLLKVIVEEYVESANPVGSSLIVNKYLQNVSSATVRNDMAELEKEGLICQPHTSAGRIPTVSGYREYLENLSSERGITKQEMNKLARVESENLKSKTKEIARLISKISDGAVFVSFGEEEFFYTGISNLFRQPEFAEMDYLHTMSEAIDHMDEAISVMFDQLDIGEIQTLMGQDNPFGEVTSVVVTKCEVDGHTSLIGILGPNRMDYRKCLGLVEYFSKLLINKK